MWYVFLLFLLLYICFFLITCWSDYFIILYTLITFSFCLLCIYCKSFITFNIKHLCKLFPSDSKLNLRNTPLKSLMEIPLVSRASGAMDNASDYGSEDSRFDSWLARSFSFFSPHQTTFCHLPTSSIAKQHYTNIWNILRIKLINEQSIHIFGALTNREFPLVHLNTYNYS